jgi:uncharacterized repeat protein (TIGR01451 family)
MDTTCLAITNETQLIISSGTIFNISGIEYFDSLTFLWVSGGVNTIPALPRSLDTLMCQWNQLSTLPDLPGTLKYLSCDNNTLTSLPALPNSLLQLSCGNNFLSSLPPLPAASVELYVDNNQLTSLPPLPPNLSSLGCSYNQLTVLPLLPSSLQYLSCSNNNLTSISSFPNNLVILYCDSNQISCFPSFPSSIDAGIPLGMTGFSISGNPFTCLPNYLNIMEPYLYIYPLCEQDSISNPGNCDIASAISGYTYEDVNTNCLRENNDSALRNIHLMRYDGTGTLRNQTYSRYNSFYTFASNDTGVYHIELDMVGMPYTFQCVSPAQDSTINITAINPALSNVNFDLKCKPGFDIGVQSVLPSGMVFPGMIHMLRILAGDMSHWFNLNCSAGTGGQVQISVSGPVTYQGAASGAMMPIVAGGSFSYNIADFGSIDNSTAFGLMFKTDTLAQSGDSICVSINVTPLNGDNNPGNNIYHFCYSVRNSLDPNMIETYPEKVRPGYDDYFTYTIHFQNSGTAPAQRVVLKDILDTNLVVETFQVINYSHENVVSFRSSTLSWVPGEELIVSFNNIMVPDSASDPEGSKGFIQYRIKPKQGLPAGTIIPNRASIYFDYNTAVVTNISINEYVLPTSLENYHKTPPVVKVYPNPGTGVFSFEIGESSTVEIYDISGRLVHSSVSKEDRRLVDLTGKEKGLYIYKIINELNEVQQGKIILQ